LSEDAFVAASLWIWNMTFQIYLSDVDDQFVSLRVEDEDRYWVGYRMAEGGSRVVDLLTQGYKTHPIA
jgi:hypothetical protein